MRPTIQLGPHTIADDARCFLIAEIGHNHQGDLETAKRLIDKAAECGAHAVKTQKRSNRNLYTKAMLERPYDNRNSFGKTYGEHREALEFDRDQYLSLSEHAESRGIVFFATAFDFESVDFLEDVGMPAYKIASGDVTNHPLIAYIAQTGKPLIMSTGAATMGEVQAAYKVMSASNDKICLLQCTAGYPVEDYSELDLNVISTYRDEFPDAIIGYSGHESGIVMPVVAYVLGARIVEKHFTLNRAMKGTDHSFSLEPAGLARVARDLERTRLALGSSEKRFHVSEREARRKMGKSLVLNRDLPAGTTIEREHVVFKSPGDGIAPAELEHVLGRTLNADLPEDTILVWGYLK
jgi:sialic acid synthase